MISGITITDEEMFRTFNMGWGFAVIVDRAEKDKTIAKLQATIDAMKVLQG
jgi:phosphoribosylaminoimidazole (AIR) synthetase